VGLSPCSREKCCVKKNAARVPDFGVYSMNKTGGWREMFITRARKMLHVDLASAQHLVSPFASSFFGVKFLYDYGLWGACWYDVYSSCGAIMTCNNRPIKVNP
jgi:hypothetical protein